MKRSDWMWVPDWDNNQHTEPAFVYFRGRMVQSQLPNRRIVQITADSRYKLYVNGRFVEMGPSRGNDHIWYVDHVDIAPYLTEGENTIAVIVLRYPYAHWKGNCGIFRTETPGLYVCADVCIEWKCTTADQIRIVSENPYFAPLMIYENVEACGSFANWMDTEYCDSEWSKPRYYDEKELREVLRRENLVPRTIPFLYRKKRNFVGLSSEASAQWCEFLTGGRTIHIPANSQLTVDIDAGELMTGYLRLRMAFGAGAQITLLQSECYAGEIVENPDPYKCLPRKGDRTDSTLKLYGYSDTYQVSGYGDHLKPEVYEPYWFRTFRYVRLTVETNCEPLELLSFHYEETGYPLAVNTNVQTSDPSMASIWDICERSLRRCMHETYADCPFYEQLQYAMDTRSQILYTYAASADPRLAIKAMDDFTHAARADGMINCSFPNFETNVIPGFSIYYIAMVYDYMMYFGDRDRINTYFTTIERILEFFDNHLDSRGFVEKIGDVNGSGMYWSFVDWVEQWDATTGVPFCTKQGPITMESLLYILGLQYAAKIADYLQRSEIAADYRIRASRVQYAVNQYCVGENGFYQDGPGVDSYSQHTQVFAVLTDTVSKEAGKKLLEATLLHPERYAQCSVAMMFYLFEALKKCGLYRYSDRLWNIWRDMVSNNLTTCAEDSLMSRSDCHAWGALALYELPSAILGVKPGKPGYDQILIEPQTQTMDWARGSVATPKGEVQVSWYKDQDCIVIHADGPQGTEITIMEG